MKFKKILSLTVASMIAFTITGCGASTQSNSGAGSTNSTSGTAKSLSVDIWDSNQQAGIQKICDKWTETSGVPVKVEVVDWNNYWTLLEAGASGGTLPDVFWMHSDYSRIYMENDMLLDLTDRISKDGVDTSMYYPDITSIYQSNGKTYAMPKDHDTIGLLYNKKLFDEAGVEYPNSNWTYENMYEAAKKITEGTPDGTYGYALNTTNDQDGWYNIVYSYGGNIVNKEKTDTAIDSASSKKAMEMVRKLLTVAVPQADVAENGTDSLFKSGKVAMITQGSWMIQSFYSAENAADYAWAEIPYADVNGDGKCQASERSTQYNGLGWAASAKTADPDSAWSLIKYLSSKEGQEMQSELGVTMSSIPGSSDAFASSFKGMDVSAFINVEKDGTLQARPGTRNSGVWQAPMKQEAGFLPAWQDPSNADLMSSCCDKVAALIRNAIAEGN